MQVAAASAADFAPAQGSAVARTADTTTGAVSAGTAYPVRTGAARPAGALARVFAPAAVCPRRTVVPSVAFDAELDAGLGATLSRARQRLVGRLTGQSTISDLIAADLSRATGRASASDRHASVDGLDAAVHGAPPAVVGSGTSIGGDVGAGSLARREACQDDDYAKRSLLHRYVLICVGRVRCCPAGAQGLAKSHSTSTLDRTEQRWRQMMTVALAPQTVTGGITAAARKPVY